MKHQAANRPELACSLLFHRVARWAAALLLLAGPIANHANASVVTVGASIASNAYVSSSMPASGVFNISASLPGKSISSATVTATFSDDTADDWQFIQTISDPYYAFQSSTPTYSGGGGTGQYLGMTRSFIKNVTDYYSNESESASLVVGVDSGSAQSGIFHNHYYSTQTYEHYFIGLNGIYQDYYYTLYYSDQVGQTGTFSITYELSAGSLADLLDGTIAVDVAGLGDFRIAGLSLAVTLEDIPQSDVPEPASIALVGGALIALSANRRKRKAM